MSESLIERVKRDRMGVLREASGKWLQAVADRDNQAAWQAGNEMAVATGAVLTDDGEPGLRTALDSIANIAHGNADLSVSRATRDAFSFIEATARAALEFTPAASDGSLDVERLARALHSLGWACPWTGHQHVEVHDEDAAGIAAEYARLAARTQVADKEPTDG
jgi:hypothetical protein